MQGVDSFGVLYSTTLLVKRQEPYNPHPYLYCASGAWLRTFGRDEAEGYILVSAVREHMAGSQIIAPLIAIDSTCRAQAAKLELALKEVIASLRPNKECKRSIVASLAYQCRCADKFANA